MGFLVLSSPPPLPTTKKLKNKFPCFLKKEKNWGGYPLFFWRGGGGGGGGGEETKVIFI